MQNPSNWIRSLCPGPIIISLPNSSRFTDLQHNVGGYQEIKGDPSLDGLDRDDGDAATESSSLLSDDAQPPHSRLDPFSVETKVHSVASMHNLFISRQYLNPFSMQNAALTLSFMNVGIAGYLLYVPVSYYLVNTLDASPAAFSAFSTLASLPWSLKFLFGILSDTTPLLGYRRKSWLLIGWLAYIALGVYMSRQAQPGVAETTLVFFLATCSYLLSDVCGDTLCVERGRAFEGSWNKGTLQTSGYTSRSFGNPSRLRPRPSLP